VTTQRAARSSRRHKGVRLLVLADGRNVARWNDPATRSLRQESLDRLGLTTERARTEWAVKKAAELVKARYGLSLALTEAEPLAIGEAVERYNKSKPVASATLSARKVPLEAFVEFCGRCGIRRLEELTIRRLVPLREAIVNDSSRKESTRNLTLGIVAAFLRWANENENTPLLPLEKIRLFARPIDQPREAIRFLRPNELRAVLAAAVASDAAGIRQRRPVAGFVLALFLTGARFAEVAGLRWREVDFEAGEIRLPAERVKTRTARSIPFAPTPALGALLRALAAKGAAPDALVFDPLWHHPVWRDHCARLQKEAGVAFSPHTLRRTAGTVLACAPGVFGGASAFLAAKRLGHSVQVAERHYAGALNGLPADARTLEAAAGVEDLAQAIVDAEAAR
jgi:integrase